MPFFISAYRIDVVLQNPAAPAAEQETRVLRTSSFEPVADFVSPDVSFIKDNATNKADDTATL
jgi:hypothetical protein